MPKESLLTKIPNNISILQTTQYTLTFPKMPFLRFFVTGVNLPAVSTNAVQVSSSIGIMKRHGDTLVYDPMNVTVLADEELNSWQETYQWLLGLTSPTSFAEYLKNVHNVNTPFANTDLYQDAILTLTTNANNPHIRIHFRDCHPTYLGMIQFNNTDDGTVIPTFDITFEYDYFSIER